MPARDSFRDRLRRRRRERGITQLELARAAGVSRSYINMVERGKVSPPSPDVVSRLERALGLSEGELGGLADLARMPERFRNLLQNGLALDEEALEGTREILDIMSAELDAAWSLPGEKRRLSRRLRPYLEHRSREVRRLACALLGRLSWSGAADDVKTALRDADAAVRAEAAHLIGNLYDEDALELLERAIVDPDLSVRLAAVEATHRRPRSDMVAPLLRCAREDPSERVREAAAGAIARVDTPPARSALAELAASRDIAVARAAGDSLAEARGRLEPIDPSAGAGRAHSITRLQQAIRAVEKSNVSEVDLRVIPVLSHTAAGDPAQLTDGDYPPGFADEYVLAPTDVSDPHAFGLRIRGDSMRPALHPGDIVIVSPQTPLAGGLKVVAKIGDGEITCKMLASSDDDRIVLTSENPDYAPMVLRREEVIWIYPVIRSIRNEFPM